MSESKKPVQVTRRDFIKGGALSVASGVLANWLKVGRAARVSAQTTSQFTYLPRMTNPGQAGFDGKRIYLAPDDHTDYFWTAGEGVYRQAFLETIDYYLDLADATADNSPEHQSRWNCDGSFWMWTYEKNKSSADFQRLINRIKSGHISVPLNALCICPGGAPTEAVLRGMYYSGKIERQYDLRFRLAYLIENQTLPYGVVSLFSGAGAKYSWKGICGCDSRVNDAWDRENEIYWWTGPDGARLLLKWNSMLVGNQGPGGYAEARDPSSVVDYVDGDGEFIARYPYQIIGAFGKGWDDLKTLTDEFVTVAKAKTTSTRKVIVSNEEDFFIDFESIYGSSLPSSGASYGNEWDLYCAALAEVSARVKRSVEKLRSAEAIATIVGVQNPSFMNGRQAARDTSWMDLGLFWEHNFGMIGPPSGLVNERIVWQKRLASEIESYVSKLHTDAVSGLGGLIEKSGSNQRFFVFNPLSWKRTDFADFPYQGSASVHVFDLDADVETPSQIVTIDGQRHLRILANDVPSVGYKVFEIRAGVGQSFPDAATVNGNDIENQAYKITLANRGAITSLIDKTRGNREFAKLIGSRYINDLGTSSGSVQVENAGPVTVTLRATASGPLQHDTRVTLIRDSKRIEIRNDIDQNFNDTFTWAFGFDLSNPDVWHEEVGAIIRARLLADGGHYSPRNARYDWLTMNHFADMTGGKVGVTLSNADCYFMKVGNSNLDTLDTGTSQLSVLVGGHVAAYGGLPDQGGDTHFLQRFALQTHGTFDPVSAMKFALEHQNPLVTGAITGGSAYPATSYSFLSISNPNVLLWALKPADDGPKSGIIARVWNLGSNSVNFELKLAPGAIVDAQRTTHIETPIEAAAVSNGALQDSIAGHQLRTYALSVGDPLPPPTPSPVPSCTSAAKPTIVPSPTTGEKPAATDTATVAGAPTVTNTAPAPSEGDTMESSEAEPQGCLYMPLLRR